MARKPGWYDDPEGLPGVYRWWDGKAWTVDITTDPKTARAGADPSTLAFAERSGSAPASAPVAVESVEPPSVGGPRTAAAATPKTTDGPTYRGPIALAVGVAVTVVAIIVSVAASIFSTFTDGTDDVESPTVDVPEFDIDDIPRGPGADGRYDGGGITYDAIRGRWIRSLMVGGVPMNNLDGEETVVAEPARGNTQYAYVWLGSVDASLVTDDLETTADAFADRFARIGYPSGSRLDDSEATPTSIGRADAVQLTRHYAYDVPGTPITGEELIVVVVDTGDTPAVCVASVPDGYPAVRRQAHLALESLRLR